MSGWLPPGVTDKDIDDAAPPSYPDCCFCGKSLGEGEHETYYNEPCHLLCKESYEQNEKGPEYEPE